MPGPANVEDEHQDEPHGKIDDRANQVPAVSQVAFLKLGERAFARRWSVQPAFIITMPGIKVPHAENGDGQKGDGKKWERASGRFERTPDDDSPMAGGQVLQHDQTKRAKRKPQKQKETHQIGREKSFRRVDSPVNRQQQRDSTHAKRTGLQAADAFRRGIFLHGHQLWPPVESLALPDWFSFSRSSAGRSATVALRLNCSART